MKKLVIYVRNETIGPSCFYRIAQYKSYLNAEVVVHSVCSEKDFAYNLNLGQSRLKLVFQLYLYIKICVKAIKYINEDIKNKVDFVFIQRTIVPRKCPNIVINLLIKLFGKTELIWDFDDNIIESGEISKKEALLLEKYAKTIIISNEILKNTLTDVNNKKLILLPTTDLILSNNYNDKSCSKRNEIFETRINLIWVGTFSNLTYVANICSLLDETAEVLMKKYKKELILTIICNVPLEYKGTYIKIRNIRWSRAVVLDEIKVAHIGIMPLQDSYYTRGKAGFKLVQYISNALPVIGSDVGFNNKVIDDSCGFLIKPENNNEWVSSILSLSTDFNKWLNYSLAARKKFCEDFNPYRNIEVLNEIIK